MLEALKGKASGLAANRTGMRKKTRGPCAQPGLVQTDADFAVTDRGLLMDH